MAVRPLGSIKRRNLLGGLGGLGLGAGLLTLTACNKASNKAKANLVVVGGGFGGVKTARDLKRLLPKAQVKLIEANPLYTACPFSNLVISGLRNPESQEFGYTGLLHAGVDIIHDWAADIDPHTRNIRLKSGATLPYDRLILSPGIDIEWNKLEGYDQTTTNALPHAWKAGMQTRLLRDQLQAMEDGGLVIISAPEAPYRCPPGPYERASLIGHYLKNHKSRSKLLILDAKDNFSKKSLFLEYWAEHYPDHIEWRGLSDDGQVIEVDAKTKTIVTNFDNFSADIANIIPPHRAGYIAHKAGVTDKSGWCPVNPLSFESLLQPYIHVIGDACIAAPMPKSAFSANLQAKICAIAVARIFAELEVEPTLLVNTCYSYLAPDAAISVSGVYDNKDGKLVSVAGAGGTSPAGLDRGIQASEAAQATGWFNAITSETFG